MKKLASLLAIAFCFAAVLSAGWIWKTPARPSETPRVIYQSGPSQESKDLAKQLNGYADAITAFCVLQSIAFAISLGNGDMRKHVLRTPFWLIPVLCAAALALYVFVVGRCDIGEDSAGGRGFILTLNWF